MAMTETRPAPEAEAVAALPEHVLADPPGIAGWLTTSDHKRVGRLWIATALLFFLAGGVLTALLGIESTQSGLDLFGRRGFNAVFSLSGEVTVLLFLLPLFLGIATLVVPLQVGSAEIAFPRGAATAYWGYLASAAVLIGAYLANGGPAGTRSEAVDLWLLALVGISLSAVVALVCLLTTVLSLRASGMTLLRTPAFSWSVLVGGSLLLLALPVLASRLVQMYVTHHFSDPPQLGAYRYEVAWFWSTPQVYVFGVFVAGIALEIVPVLAKARLRMHAAALVVVGLVGVASVGAWAQVADTRTDPLYVLIGLFAVLPALALLGLLADTARGGKPAPKAAFALALGSALHLLVGAVAGALLAIDGMGVHDTIWETGQSHIVVLGAGALAALAALWWWAPKIWGKQLSEAAGFLAFLTVFGGSALLGVAELVNGKANDLGLTGSGRFEFDDGGSVPALGGIATAGAVLLTIGALVTLLAVLATLRSKGDTAANPWEGGTLEWSTSSPPSRSNFDGPVPAVVSATPLLADEEPRS
jgi:cytochrome c oxidase subunit 1